MEKEITMEELVKMVNESSGDIIIHVELLVGVFCIRLVFFNILLCLAVCCIGVEEFVDVIIIL